jgi:hypothetical protein
MLSVTICKNNEFVSLSCYIFTASIVYSIRELKNLITNLFKVKNMFLLAPIETKAKRITVEILDKNISLFAELYSLMNDGNYDTKQSFLYQLL